MSDKLDLTEDQWRDRLSREQFHVLREAGTERAFSGAYDKLKDEGGYHCAGCGNLVFRSSEKYDSGSGWPSFYAPAEDEGLASWLAALSVDRLNRVIQRWKRAER